MYRVIKAAKDRINAADDDVVETLADKLEDLEDDFDFLVSGIQKLLRDDENSPEAGSIIAGTKSALADAISRVAEEIG